MVWVDCEWSEWKTEGTQPGLLPTAGACHGVEIAATPLSRQNNPVHQGTKRLRRVTKDRAAPPKESPTRNPHCYCLAELRSFGNGMQNVAVLENQLIIGEWGSADVDPGAVPNLPQAVGCNGSGWP